MTLDARCVSTYLVATSLVDSLNTFFSFTVNAYMSTIFFPVHFLFALLLLLFLSRETYCLICENEQQQKRSKEKLGITTRPKNGNFYGSSMLD